MIRDTAISNHSRNYEEFPAMTIYQRIYENLCLKGQLNKSLYCKGSGLHKHHIKPKHSKGADNENNLTYLTPREHTIAHFLLWKIYKNPNDLRSMHMLGAKLTVKQRQITGYYCRDNKIGIYGCSKQQRLKWSKQGLESQKASGEKNTFYYWSTEDGRKERASLGGKTTYERKSNQEWLYWMSPEGHKKRASMGGKSHKGKRCMHKPGDTSFKRIPKNQIQQKLNDGWVFGSPIKSKNQYTKSSDI